MRKKIFIPMMVFIIVMMMGSVAFAYTGDTPSAVGYDYVTELLDPNGVREKVVLTKNQPYATDEGTYFTIYSNGPYITYYTDDGGTTWQNASGELDLSVGSSGEGQGTLLSVSYGDLTSQDGSIVFFPMGLSSMVAGAQPMTVLSQILIVLSSVVGLTVLAIGLRKAWTFLVRKLKQA